MYCWARARACLPAAIAADAGSIRQRRRYANGLSSLAIASGSINRIGRSNCFVNVDLPEPLAPAITVKVGMF